MISPAHFFDTAFGGLRARDREGRPHAARPRAAARDGGARPDPRRRARVGRARSTTSLALATRPVVASHTGVRGDLRQRAQPDRRPAAGDRRDRRAGRDRVLGTTACGGDDAASIARSIVHAVSVIGAEHVGLGSDWDGAVPVPFDAAGLPALTDALLEAGLDEADDPRRDGRERAAPVRGDAARGRRRAAARPAAAISAAARAAPSRSTGREVTGRSISCAIASAMASGSDAS